MPIQFTTVVEIPCIQLKPISVVDPSFVKGKVASCAAMASTVTTGNLHPGLF